MSTSLHRLVSTILLLGWLAPSVGALGVGLHLASEHHDHHDADHHDVDQDDADHHSEIADLVRAVAHGHHHALDAVPHRHEARIDGTGPSLKPDLAPTALFSTLLSPAAAPTARPPLDGSWRRGPPTPLFTTHCSLLL